MYRDDVCAVCGESLPPDHLYCREHAAEIDDRLRELGGLLPGLLEQLRRLSDLTGGIADETWDYVAEGEADDPAWPPAPRIKVLVDPDEVNIDVDSEPGLVSAELEIALPRLLAALADGLDTADVHRMAAACARAEGAGATH